MGATKQYKIAGKILLTTLLAVAMLSPANAKAAHKTHPSFYKEYKHQKGMTHLSLSSGLARLLLGGKDNGDLKKLLKCARKVHLLVYDDKKNKSEMRCKMAKSLSSANYKDLLTIGEGGNSVTLKMRQDGENIKELVMLASDGDDLVAIVFDGKIRKSEISELARSIHF